MGNAMLGGRIVSVAALSLLLTACGGSTVPKAGALPGNTGVKHQQLKRNYQPKKPDHYIVQRSAQPNYLQQNQQKSQQARQQQYALQQKRQQQLAQQRKQQAARQTTQQRQQHQQRNQQQPQRVQQTYAQRRHTQAPSAGVQRFQTAAARVYNGQGKYKRLPDVVATKLKLRGVSEHGMSAYVRDASGRAPALLTAKADTPRTPASTIKLVTSYAALGILGPNYRWPTELYTTGQISGGTLHGDVIIKGYGDPDFREPDFLRLLQVLRSKGVNSIKGNLVVDNSYFRIPNANPGAFDGKPKASYNAIPEAVLYNERGGCYEFRNLAGKIQKVCPVMPKSGHQYNALNTNLYGGFWKLWVGQLRGQMQGAFRRGNTPANARLVHTHYSKPLRNIMRRVNKKSNNVMTRQIMLSLGAKQMGAPGTPQKGAQAVGRFLESRGLRFPELRIENGSGLSRVAKISARHLGEMLVDAYNSPYRNDLMQSLAVLGVDGTLRNRMKKSGLAGRGKFKTGTLRNVRGLAGYLHAADGKTYVVSILHNDPRARRKARGAHDALIKWVYQGSRNQFASR